MFDAVDGRQLTQEMLNEMGVKQLAGYEDPYHKRALKFGEIGLVLDQPAPCARGAGKGRVRV